MRRVAVYHLSQRFPFSTVPKSSRRAKPKTKKQKNGGGDTTAKSHMNVGDTAMLFFNEITEVMGTIDGVAESKMVTGVSRTAKQNDQCVLPVYSKSELENKRLDKSVLKRVVDEIAEIVRNEDGSVMDLKLSGFPVSVEIVEKVLQCLLEMPHSAFRFFDWAKSNGCPPNRKILNILVCIAGEAKEYDLLGRMLTELENNLSMSDVETWTLLIVQFGKANLLSKALLCCERLEKSGCELGAEFYGIMIRLLCDAGKIELALKFHMEMIQRKMKPDLTLFRILLRDLSISGNVLSIRLVSDQMIELHQLSERDVYGSVLKSLCLSGRVAEVLELIQGLRNRGKYLETLITGLRRTEKGEALEAVQLVKKAGRVDEIIYGNIISKFLRKNELSKALDLFESMKELGHQPARTTYTELMQYLFNIKRYDKGCKLYEELVKAGLEVDNAAIMNVVSGYVLINNLSEALQVFRSLKGKHIRPSLESVATIFQALGRVSRIDDILKFLQEALAFNFLDMEKIFDCVVSSMSKMGNAEDTEKIVEMRRIYQLHSLEDDQNVEKSWSVAFLRKSSKQVESEKPYNQQDFQKANKILSSSENWVVIQEELEKCTFQFTPELVVDILRENSRRVKIALNFFTWIGNQAGYKHNADSYNMAIKIAGGGKDFASMRKLFHEMRRKNISITADTWAIKIMQYGRTGLTKTALRTFFDMKRKGYEPSYSTYKCLITCLCEKKPWKIDIIIQMFQTMIHSGHIPERKLAETYLIWLCEKDKVSVARKCANSMCSIGYRSVDSYSLYVRALCRAGRVEEALAFVNGIDSELCYELEKNTFGSLVHGLLWKGRLEEALTRIETMKQMGIYPSSHVYTSLIVHFFKEKQPGKALEVLGKMKKEGCDPTGVTYYSIIRGYMKLERVADAWKVFHSLKPIDLDFKMYSMFIDCLCRHGGSEEALQLVEKMKQNGIVPSCVNYRTVFFGLNREGKHKLAQTVLQKKSSLKSERQFSK